MNKFGYNVLSVPDRNRLYNHARALHPPAMLFYSHMGGTAQEFAATFPDCVTILRHWPDGTQRLMEDPAKWLDSATKDIPDNIYHYTSNEVGWSPALINWHVQVMKVAIQRRKRLCILNMGVGQPGPDSWKDAKELITLASQHRDLFVLGLHEYSGGVITSGLIGGDPTFIQPDTWPAPAKAKALTRWHCGRLKFLIDQCKEWGITPPRVIITEAGFDFTGDIGTWLNRLRFTPPNKSINGWKTLVDQWRDWWPMWTAEEAYAKQLLWAQDALWSDAEAVLLFGWGDSGGWGAYDVSAAGTLQTALESATPLPQQPPPPVEIPTPTPPPPPPQTPPEPPAPVRRYARIVALLRQLADELDSLDNAA